VYEHTGCRTCQDSKYNIVKYKYYTFHIQKWAAEFKRGCTSLEADPCEGHSKNATTPEIIEQVHDMVLDN
jgi:hypothetical protein